MDFKKEATLRSHNMKMQNYTISMLFDLFRKRKDFVKIFEIRLSHSSFKGLVPYKSLNTKTTTHY